MASRGDPSGQTYQPVLAAIVDLVKAEREFYQEHPQLRDADALYGTSVEGLDDGGRRLHLDEDSYVDIHRDILLHVEQDDAAAKVWFHLDRTLRYVRQTHGVGLEEYFLSGDQVRERAFADIEKLPFCHKLMAEIDNILTENFYYPTRTHQYGHRRYFGINSRLLDRAARTIQA